MSPIPNLEEREHEQHERERELAKPQWSVTVENWKELGEAISTFNAAIGSFAFAGVAEQSIDDDRVVTLVITLYHQMGECAPINSDRTERCGTPVCSRCRGIPF